MTKRWTDEDVEKLVEAASKTRQAIEERIPLSPMGGHHKIITAALKPFLPDPEDELAGKMAKVFNATAFSLEFPSTVGAMQTLLQFLKEEGVLKEIA